jgi:flagellar protein FliS
MNEKSYQERALAGAPGITLIIALYDASIRFLYRAIQCVEDKDVRGRRLAVKKAVDIFMYLQARLRPELGPAPSAALSEFYTAMFNKTLEASYAASVEQFEVTIACIRNVRDAWVVAARDPAVGKLLPRELRTFEEKFRPATTRPEPYDGEAPVTRWSA